jgi:coenzyme F420-reducing hydrogenase delta subunit/Pyruvate/2-oxoacid:ferredoxin oxidoreductase delta subunit
MTMPPQRICVLGNNACAWEIAERLGQAQLGVILAAADEARDPRTGGNRSGQNPRVETLSGVRLAACSGQLGRFDLVFDRCGTPVRQTVAAVVLAESDEHRSNEALYDLKPANGIVAISNLLNSGGRPPAAAASWRQAVFLNGLRAEGHPAMAGRVMRAALRLQNEFGVQCHILTRHLKVAGEGLEALAREARAAGVLFFKFSHTDPALLQNEEGGVRVHFLDEPTGKAFELTPDLVVVDESVRPSPYALALGHVLGVEADPAGFVQGDNVHRLPVATNRRGIIVAGPARALGSDPAVEAANGALEVLLGLAAADRSSAAQIEAGQCIRCLTCLRVCPYRAVALDGRPQVLPAACERCGICAAECPREAIRIAGLEREDLHRLVAAGRPGDPTEGRPSIVAFCCRRSAGPALHAAVAAGIRWAASLNVIEVPCAGSLAPEVILSAFCQGADGVLVLACHLDNCHSRHGNQLVHQRTDRIATFLESSGGGAARLRFKTLAANMPAEAAAVVTEFSATLADLQSNVRPA